MDIEGDNVPSIVYSIIWDTSAQTQQFLLYLVLYKIWIQRRNSIYSVEHMNVVLSRDYVFRVICVMVITCVHNYVLNRMLITHAA